MSLVLFLTRQDFSSVLGGRVNLYLLMLSLSISLSHTYHILQYHQGNPASNTNAQYNLSQQLQPSEPVMLMFSALISASNPVLIHSHTFQSADQFKCNSTFSLIPPNTSHTLLFLSNYTCALFSFSLSVFLCSPQTLCHI